MDGLERSYDLTELPEWNEFDYVEVTPHRGKPCKWTVGGRRGWGNDICLVAYNPAEWLLFYGCDSFDEYFEECREWVKDEDMKIVKQLADNKVSQIWELYVVIDERGSNAESILISGDEIKVIDDVYRTLREGFEIYTRDYIDVKWIKEEK